MKRITWPLATATLMLCGSASASETLNIPALPGFTSSPYCMPSDKGGMMHPSNAMPACEIEFPLPLVANRTVKQIALLYGGNGPAQFDAQIFTRHLAVTTISSSVDQMMGPGWTSNPSPADTTIYAANLMAESGSPITYPDAFSTAADMAYFVHVSLRAISGPAEVFGLRVLYD